MEAGQAPIQWGNLPIAIIPVVTPITDNVPITDTTTKTPKRKTQSKPADSGGDDTVTIEAVKYLEYVHPVTAEYAGRYLCAPVTDADPAPITPDTLYVFADGGAIANGKPECEASWAFFFTDGVNTVRASGKVEPKFLIGCKFQASNNRGELTAILHAMEYLLGLHGTAPPTTYKSIIIISDSDLSIKGIDQRDLIGKMNVDLLSPSKDYVARLRTKTPVSFRHVRAAHDIKLPEDPHERFLWYGNKIVDSLCNVVLGLNDKKQRINKK